MNKTKLVVINNYLLDNEKVVHTNLSLPEWYVFNCVNNLNNYNLSKGYDYGFVGTLESFKTYLDFPCKVYEYNIISLLQKLLDEKMLWAKFDTRGQCYTIGSYYAQKPQVTQTQPELRGVEIE